MYMRISIYQNIAMIASSQRYVHRTQPVISQNQCQKLDTLMETFSRSVSYEPSAPVTKKEHEEVYTRPSKSEEIVTANLLLALSQSRIHETKTVHSKSFRSLSIDYPSNYPFPNYQHQSVHEIRENSRRSYSESIVSEARNTFDIHYQNVSSPIQDIRHTGRCSPEERKKKIARYLEKRQRRVWKKKITYKVRKNFADSRVRYKGRFITKDEESKMKEEEQREGSPTTTNNSSIT